MKQEFQGNDDSFMQPACRQALGIADSGLSCRFLGSEGRSEYPGRNRSFAVQGFDFLHQRIDLFRPEFDAEFRHVALAVSDNVAQLVGRGSANFATHERWSPKVTALSGFAMALRAISNIDRICSQGRVRRVVLAESCRERKETKTQRGCELEGFQIGPLCNKSSRNWML